MRDENGTEIGIAAIDLLMRNIAAELKSKNHIVIFTRTGEIVYNSEPNIRYVLEKRYNINLLVGRKSCMMCNKKKLDVKNTTLKEKIV
jgi:hypothetical protein